MSDHDVSRGWISDGVQCDRAAGMPRALRLLAFAALQIHFHILIFPFTPPSTINQFQ